jgi:hypothetical protein
MIEIVVSSNYSIPSKLFGVPFTYSISDAAREEEEEEQDGEGMDEVRRRRRRRKLREVRRARVAGRTEEGE